MTNTANPNLRSILDTLNNADAIRVDGSPLLTDFHNEEGEINFQWVDEDSNVFTVIIEHGDLTEAELTNNTLKALTAEGEPVTVELFNLTPAPFPGRALSRQARFVEKVIEFGKLDREELIEILDDLMYRAVGDDEASRINNQGPEEQVKVLVERGYEALMMDTLSDRTGLQARLLA